MTRQNAKIQDCAGDYLLALNIALEKKNFPLFVLKLGLRNKSEFCVYTYYQIKFNRAGQFILLFKIA